MHIIGGVSDGADLRFSKGSNDIKIQMDDILDEIHISGKLGAGGE